MAQNGVMTIAMRANTSNLTSGLNQAQNAIGNFTNRAESRFNKLKSVMNGVADNVFNKFTALGTTWLGGQAINDIAKFEASLARLGIQAGKTPAEMAKVRAEIFKLGKTRGISKEDALAGITAMVDRTGDLDGAVATFDTLTLASQASGSQMESLGILATNLGSKMGLANNQMTTALATLLEQGKAGEFQLKDLADQGERLFSAGASFNMTGMKGVSQLGGIMQVIRSGTGSTEMATTAFESLTRDLVSKKSQLKKKLGVDIIDPVASKKAGKEVFRDLDVIMQELIVKSKGQKGLLMEAGIGDEAIRALNAMIAEYDRLGPKAFEADNKLKGFVKTTGNLSNLQKDASQYAETFDSKMTRLKATWDELANNTLAKPGGIMDRLGDAMKWASENADTMNTALKVTLGLMAGLAVLKAGSMVAESIGTIRDVFGRGGRGGGLGGGLGGMAGATPVFVTNMPGGGLGGGMGGGLGGGFGDGLGNAGRGGRTFGQTMTRLSRQMSVWFGRNMPTLFRMGQGIGRMGSGAFSVAGRLAGPVASSLGRLGPAIGRLAVSAGPAIGVMGAVAFTGYQLVQLWDAYKEYQQVSKEAEEMKQRIQQSYVDSMNRQYGSKDFAEAQVARSQALADQIGKETDPRKKAQLEIERMNVRKSLGDARMAQLKKNLASGTLSEAEKATAQAEMKSALETQKMWLQKIAEKEKEINVQINVGANGQVTTEARGGKVNLNKGGTSR